MKEIPIEELKDLQVDMLEKIHHFCIKTYSLFYKLSLIIKA